MRDVTFLLKVFQQINSILSSKCIFGSFRDYGKNQDTVGEHHNFGRVIIYEMMGRNIKRPSLSIKIC